MADPYVEFFLKSPASIVQLETIEMSHPNFSKTYYVVRNNSSGMLAYLEDEVTQVFFEYYPIQLSPSTSRDDLDYGMEVKFGGLGEVLPDEFDAIQAANGFDTKPIFKYRTYRSDDLSKPMFGPIELEVDDVSFNKTGATIKAIAPQANLHKTGRIYRVDDFPMMRGFLT